MCGHFTIHKNEKQMPNMSLSGKRMLGASHTYHIVTISQVTNLFDNKAYMSRYIVSIYSIINVSLLQVYSIVLDFGLIKLIPHRIFAHANDVQ